MTRFNASEYEGTHVRYDWVIPSDGSALVIPDAHLLFSGTFRKAGPDLIIEGDGKRVLLPDYFTHEAAPLHSIAGARLEAETVRALAGLDSPWVLAQAGGAAGPVEIGTVRKLVGTASVVRGSSTQNLANGDPVYQGDVVQTGGASTLGIILKDNTVFSLSADARMVMNQLVYDASRTDNSMSMSLVQGSFVFITGQVAKTGTLSVSTPVATMGIRGTTPIVKLSALDGSGEFSLSADPDRGVGNYILYDLNGNEIARVGSTDITVRIQSAAGPFETVTKSLADTAADNALVAPAFETYLLINQRGDIPSLRAETGKGQGSDTFQYAFKVTNIALLGETKLLDDGLFGTLQYLASSRASAPNDILNPATGPFAVDLDTSSPGINRFIGFTENSGALPVATSAQISVPNGATTIASATIVLVNALAGDDMVVLFDALPPGITATITFGSIHVNLTGNASVQAYLAAIQSIKFINTADNPATDVREIIVTVNASNGDTATATTFVTIEAVNDAPVNVVPSSQVTGEDSSLVYSQENGNAITVADPDADSHPVTTTLTVQHGTLTAGAIVTGVTISGNGSGTLVLTGPQDLINQALDGLAYHPTPGFNGTDAVVVSTNDNNTDGSQGSGGPLLTTTAGSGIDVTSVNDAPVGSDGSLTTNEDTPVVLNVADFGYSDPNDIPPNALLAVEITTLPDHGSLVLDGYPIYAGQSISAVDIADGKLVFTPASNSTAPTAFTFQVQDDGGSTSGSDLDQTPRTLSITITPVNDAPVAVADGPFTVAEDHVLVVDAATGVLANDSDVDGPALTAAVVDGPQHGTLALAPDGSFTYTPYANYNGADSFTYTASDGTASSGIATVTLAVTAVNDAPVAVADGPFTVAEDHVLVVDAATGVLANDSDVDGPALTAAVVDGPQHGTLALAPDGSFTYTPYANYNGADSFTYTASDGTASSGIATVTLAVTAVNDAPIGTAKTITTEEDTPVTLTVYDFGFTDPNDSPANALLSVTITSLPDNQLGVLTLDGYAVNAGQAIDAADIVAGKLVFIPAQNASGLTDLYFQVQDNGGAVNGGVDLDPTPRTLSLSVTAVNDAAVVSGGSTSLPTSGYAVETLNPHFTPYESSPGVYQLTGALQSQAAAVWQAIDLSQNWTWTTQVQLSSGFSPGGADGITFTLQTQGTTALTQLATDGGNHAGGSLGVGGFEDADTFGLPNAFGIWIDTWPNGQTIEANGNSISFYANDSTGLTDLPPGAAPHEFNSFIENGQWNDLKVIWDAATHTLSYQFTATDTGETFSSSQIFDDLVTGQPYYFGFSATTGAAFNVQAVSIESVESHAIEQTPMSLKASGFSIADVDAENGILTATLHLGDPLQGYLDASVGDSGISIVSGNGTAELVVSGTLQQLNSFLGQGGTSTLTFTPTLDDPSGSTSLTLTVDDNGNSGAGGPLSGSFTSTIVIESVNDDPINSVPYDQETGPDQTVTFSAANGNAIAVTDADAGAGLLTVILDASYGTFTLADPSLLDDYSGQGSGHIVLSGTVDAINATLATGVIYTADPYAYGTDTITVTTSDNGHSGIGGALIATDAIDVIIAGNSEIIANTDDGVARVNNWNRALYNEDAIGNVLDNDSTAGGSLSVTTISNGVFGDVVPADGETTLQGQFGTLTLASDGAYTYTPDHTLLAMDNVAPGNMPLTDTFTYGVSDGSTGTTSSLTIRVSPSIAHLYTNPDANAAIVSIDSEQSGTPVAIAVDVRGNVIENDYGEENTDGSPFVIGVAREIPGGNTSISTQSVVGEGASFVIQGLYGTLSIHSNGHYTYQTDGTNAAVQDLAQYPQNGVLSDVFTYTAEFEGVTRTETLTITVTGTLALDDYGTALEAGGVNGNVPGYDATGNVLANDNGLDTITDIRSVYAGQIGGETYGYYGVLRMEADGSYSYTVNPDIQFIGEGQHYLDAFTYSANANGGPDYQATLTIDITGQNNAPVTTPFVAPTIASDHPSTYPSAYSVFVWTGIADDSFLSISVNASASGIGSLAGHVSSDTYSFYLFDVPTLFAHLQFGEHSTVTVSYVANDGTYATPGTFTFDVVGDHTPQASNVNVTLAEAGGVNNSTAGTPSASGNLLDHVSDPDIQAHADTVHVTSINGIGFIGSITIDYGSVTFAVSENGAFTITLNDADAFNEMLSANSSYSTGATYTVTDSLGFSSTGLIALTVNGANDAPVALSDQQIVAVPAVGDSVVYIGNVLTNDTDVDFDAQLHVSFISGAGGSGSVGSSGRTVEGSFGELTIHDDGTYSYAPLATSASGAPPPDVFHYTITDDQGATSISTLTFDRVHDTSPVAVADTNLVEEATGPAALQTGGTVAIGNVITSDIDADGDALSVVGISSAGTASGTVGRAISGEYGTLLIAADGSYRYVADDNQGISGADPAVDKLGNGDTLVDTFTYTIADSQGVTTSSTLAITINGHDDAPRVSPLNFSIDEDYVEYSYYSGDTSDFNIAIVDSAYDPEGTSLQLQNVTVTPTLTTAAGTVLVQPVLFTVNESGNISFDVRQFYYLQSALGGDTSGTPDALKLTIGYDVSDDTGLTTHGTATLEIAGLNEGETFTGLGGAVETIDFSSANFHNTKTVAFAADAPLQNPDYAVDVLSNFDNTQNRIDLSNIFDTLAYGSVNASNIDHFVKATFDGTNVVVSASAISGTPFNIASVAGTAGSDHHAIAAGDIIQVVFDHANVANVTIQ